MRLDTWRWVNVMCPRRFLFTLYQIPRLRVNEFMTREPCQSKVHETE